MHLHTDLGPPRFVGPRCTCAVSDVRNRGCIGCQRLAAFAFFVAFAFADVVTAARFAFAVRLAGLLGKLVLATFLAFAAFVAVFALTGADVVMLVTGRRR